MSDVSKCLNDAADGSGWFNVVEDSTVSSRDSAAVFAVVTATSSSSPLITCLRSSSPFDDDVVAHLYVPNSLMFYSTLGAFLSFV